MKKIEKLTDAQWARIYECRDEWLSHGLSTEPADRETAERAIIEHYRWAGMDAPRFLWLSSPMGCVLARHALTHIAPRDVGAQVGDQVRAQVVAQVVAQVWAQVGDQVGDQVRDQVWDQVVAQVVAQVWAQVGDQVGDQVRAQVVDQVGAQVGAQVGDQVGAQVRAQVGDQVGAQVVAQVGAQVWAQVGDQVRDQVWDQVRDQVWDQVGAQVGDQVGDQVRDQVWDQVRDQVRDQVWDQVGAQVGDQVWAQVRAQVGDQVGAQVGGVSSDGAFWGQHEASWVAFYDALRTHAGVKFNYDVDARFSVVADLARSASWWYPSRGVCFVSDRPLAVRMETGPSGLLRTHSEDSPAIEYRDGWSIYAINGVRVPEKVVMAPESFTIEELRAIENIEVRRIAIERFGVSRYLTESGAKTVDMDTFGGTPRALIRDDVGEQWMVGTDGSTARVYHMSVPREAQTCREAHVAICGFDESRIVCES